MSEQRQRPIEMFDEVRGDMLSICREDFVEIYEYGDRDFLEVFRGLGAFFVGCKGDPEPEIKARDKRNIGVIKRLIEHQKVNAMHELMRKKSGKDAADSRWRDKQRVQAVNANASERMRENANASERIRENANALDIAEEEDLDTASAVVSKSSVAGAEQGGPTPPVRPALSVKDAKKIIAMDAPELLSHPQMKSDNGQPTGKARTYARMNADQALLTIAAKIYGDEINPDNEDGEWYDTLSEIKDSGTYFEEVNLPQAFYKTDGGKFVKAALGIIRKIYGEYGKRQRYENKAVDLTDDVFKRALLDGYFSAKKAKNPAAWILARLKRVLEAVQVIEAEKDSATDDLK